ncbi:MAG: oligopeptide transporter, OPT family [Gammaproteobacteria bacterium]|nr:oligopeptide transporter, OPT family [Gammaproteobacteria bacterium]MCP4088750.1 oligopeptide transporter, OPT family [Gammaproteobacteria bacterium]MCP4275207.1 oligopeptide transporter, OPT family [Gammaproteobacteria bacterium]MCP4830783.1 oligopeptide transporter, OPT family [Gammaproteobacteria bacterium]MCP4929572.1 oligopeptide transporter, OPT family [Gammaproteobacteria bacterium]
MTTHPPPQLTFKAIILGILLAMVLAGANAYLGLFAGMTVSASIPAAVISMGLLRLFKNSNILENNIVQTAASAGESVAAGTIFTLPALILMGYWKVFDYWWVCAIAGIGGLLGVLFTIPLRRSLIVEQALPFPEGTATAEVLKVGDNPSHGLKFLLLAGLTGALAKFAESGLRLWPGTAQAGVVTGSNTVFYAGMNLSPALISVGYIVGLNIAALVFAGGLISWAFAIPIYSTFFMQPDTQGISATDLAYTLWSTKIRYIGVGAMLMGGIWALVSIRGSVVSGIRSSWLQYRASKDAFIHHQEQDVPIHFVIIGILIFVLPLFMLYQHIVNDVGVGIALTLVMLVAGFLFSVVGGYMAGLVGSSNNPVSGITIATILGTSLLLLWLTGATQDAAAAAILIGAVICCAAAIAGDNMQDLKAGYLLGATPWKQQLMQGIGVISAVLIIAPVLNLLLTAYGIGPVTEAQPNSLTAPQATLMASVASGVLGGQLPWGFISTGIVIGIIVIAVDEWLRSKNTGFRMPILAVAVGIYLPLELAVPIFIGGLIKWLSSRHQHTAASNVNGTLLAAGLITGEALIGILIAIPIVISGNPNILALANPLFGPAGGILILLFITAALWRIASQNLD